jgi:DNA primase
VKYFQIIKSFDWRGYIEANHKYKPTQGSRGEEYRVCCPFCKEDDFKCYVNLDRKVFCCFKCSASSRKNNVFDFVAATEGISLQAATL